MFIQLQLRDGLVKHVLFHVNAQARKVDDAAHLVDVRFLRRHKELAINDILLCHLFLLSKKLTRIVWLSNTRQGITKIVILYKNANACQPRYAIQSVLLLPRVWCYADRNHHELWNLKLC